MCRKTPEIVSCCRKASQVYCFGEMAEEEQYVLFSRNEELYRLEKTSTFNHGACEHDILISHRYQSLRFSLLTSKSPLFTITVKKLPTFAK
jgi:hypothetical protein